MGQVTIGTNVYEIYGESDDANAYIRGLLSAETWINAPPDDNNRSLVMAARIFNRTSWKGEQTVDGQPLAWPRTGIESVDENTIPGRILDGSYELAFLVFQDQAIYGQANTSSNTKFIKAGTVELELFRPTLGTPLPASVNEIVKEFLGGGVTAGTVSGCDVSTSLGEDYGLIKGYP